jgi:thiamine-phosphate diphosphorylase
LGLVVITDARLAHPRSVGDVVDEALAAGARCIQLRDKQATARELAQQAATLLERTRRAGALLIVNDRADVALAIGADGVHVGPRDLPVAAIRRIAPPPFLIGASTDQPERAVQLVAEGADYLGCGAVFGTTTKDVGDEAIGLARLHAVCRAVSVPVVGIGGVTAPGARAIRAQTAAAGVAVIQAVMAADDVGAAVRGLLA